jgi:hypothetical protein
MARSLRMYHDAAGPTGAREATAPRGLLVGRCLSTRSSRGTGDAVISLRPPYHCRRHRPGAKLFVRKHQTARGSVRIYRQGSPRAPADSPAVRAVWPVPWSPSAECRHRVRDDLEHARWQRCKRRGERCEVTGLGICARASITATSTSSRCMPTRRSRCQRCPSPRSCACAVGCAPACVRPPAHATAHSRTSLASQCA